jgi:hypothetical protein
VERSRRLARECKAHTTEAAEWKRLFESEKSNREQLEARRASEDRERIRLAKELGWAEDAVKDAKVEAERREGELLAKIRSMEAEIEQKIEQGVEQGKDSVLLEFIDSDLMGELREAERREEADRLRARLEEVYPGMIDWGLVRGSSSAAAVGGGEEVPAPPVDAAVPVGGGEQPGSVAEEGEAL